MWMVAVFRGKGTSLGSQRTKDMSSRTGGETLVAGQESRQEIGSRDQDKGNRIMVQQKGNLPQ